MFVLVIAAGIAVAVALLVIFLAVVVGTRQAHPTDLALQRPTVTAAVARQVVGLYVRRGEPQRQEAPGADWERAAR